MAMASANSWHPAFMPNSLADDIIIPEKSTPPSSQTPIPESAIPAPVSTPGAPQVDVPENVVDATVDIREEKDSR